MKSPVKSASTPGVPIYYLVVSIGILSVLQVGKVVARRSNILLGSIRRDSLCIKLHVVRLPHSQWWCKNFKVLFSVM